MTVPGGFPARGLWRRPGLRWADILVGAALLGLLFGFRGRRWRGRGRGRVWRRG